MCPSFHDLFQQSVPVDFSKAASQRKKKILSIFLIQVMISVKKNIKQYEKGVKTIKKNVCIISFETV